MTFPGFLPLFFFTPKPLTLFFAKLAAASIATGARALAAAFAAKPANAPRPLPFLVFLGFFVFSVTCKSGGSTTTPKPVVLIIPFKTSPITPLPFLGLPLFFIPEPV